MTQPNKSPLADDVEKARELISKGLSVDMHEIGFVLSTLGKLAAENTELRGGGLRNIFRKSRC